MLRRIALVCVLAALALPAAALAKSVPWHPGTYVGHGLTFTVSKSQVALTGGSVKLDCDTPDFPKVQTITLTYKPVRISVKTFLENRHTFKAGDFSKTLHYSGQTAQGEHFTATEAFQAAHHRLTGSKLGVLISINREYTSHTVDAEGNPQSQDSNCDATLDFTAKRR